MEKQASYAVSASEKETTPEKPSATLAVKAQAKGVTSLTATANGMTKGEALAVTWTGVEALKQMGAAKIFRSSAEAGVIWIKLANTEYSVGSGLVEV